MSRLGKHAWKVAYGDAPGLWNPNPPLSFWAVVGGYLALGFIAWDLRLPKALRSLCYLGMFAMLSWLARQGQCGQPAASERPEMENPSRMRALRLPTCMGARNWVK